MVYSKYKCNDFVAFAAPKVSYITTNTCRVDWMQLKPMGDDAIVYIVQMSVGQTGSYREVSDDSTLSGFGVFSMILLVSMPRYAYFCNCMYGVNSRV